MDNELMKQSDEVSKDEEEIVVRSRQRATRRFGADCTRQWSRTSEGKSDESKKQQRIVE